MSIVVVGVTSAGKSTLVNALLGRFILPVGVQETTTVPVVVDAARRFRERAVQWNALKAIVADDTAVRREIEAAFEQVPLTPVRVSLRPVRMAPQFRPGIRFFPSRLRPGYLVDLPGVLSADDGARIELVRRWATSADVVVAVLSAEDTDSARETAMLTALRGVAAERFVVLLNRVDAYLRPDARGDRAEDFAKRRDRVRAATGVDVEPVPLSGSAALCAEVLGPGRPFATSADLDDCCANVPLALLTEDVRDRLPRVVAKWTPAHRKAVAQDLYRASGIGGFFAALGRCRV